jgi:hypothetical protein
MAKGTIKKKVKEENSLVMKGSSGTYYPLKVVVEFEREKSEGRYVHPSMRDLHKPKLIAPTFNSDRTHFTPTFSLQGDPLDRDYYHDKHQSKVKQYSPIE